MKNSITYTIPDFWTRGIFSNGVYKGYAYKNSVGNWILQLDEWGQAGIYDNLPELKSWVASALDGVEKYKKLRRKEKEKEEKKSTYDDDDDDDYPNFEHDGCYTKVTTRNGNTCTRKYVQDLDVFANYTEKGYIGSGTPRRVGDFKL